MHPMVAFNNFCTSTTSKKTSVQICVVRFTTAMNVNPFGTILQYLHIHTLFHRPKWCLSMKIIIHNLKPSSSSQSLLLLPLIKSAILCTGAIHFRSSFTTAWGYPETGLTLRKPTRNAVVAAATSSAIHRSEISRPSSKPVPPLYQQLKICQALICPQCVQAPSRCARDVV